MRNAFPCGLLLIELACTFVTPGQTVTGPPSAFTCAAQAGTPVIVRAEGITELVGDLLLQCTGGNPTPRGQPIPVSNVQLTLNTNVTSRLIGSTGFTDALLLIDEPYPASAPIAIFPPPPPPTNPPDGFDPAELAGSDHLPAEQESGSR